jgi:hypothetical protein
MRPYLIGAVERGMDRTLRGELRPSGRPGPRDDVPDPPVT